MEQLDDCLREVEEALQFPEEENDTIEEENHSARRFIDKIAIIETENRINRLREAAVTRWAGMILIPNQAGLMMKGAGREQVATSPCAACKLLRRRCTQDCVFAPYFPVKEPQKFVNVPKVFGASNVNKMLQENGKNVLPLSWKDLTNTPPDETALDLKAFLRFIRRSVLNIPPKYHGALLLLCGGFLSYQAKNMSTPFHFPFQESTNTPQSLLSFGEAFGVFSPEMAHITKFILCYFLTLMLVWQLHPGVQIFWMLLLISAPLFYFPELVSKASRIDVACGSFKLPLIWFATLGALGLSLICGLLTLLMVYFSWRFIYKGIPRAEEIEVSLDALSEILDGVN